MKAIQFGTSNQSPTIHLLINSRTDVAISCGAHGVHLRADDLSPVEVREIYRKCGKSGGTQSFDFVQDKRPRDSLIEPVISISCHSAEEVLRAEKENATFALFAPVFEKSGASPAGLEKLTEACQCKIPVLALGGVTLENAAACLHAGAIGVAGIRLFQEGDLEKTVQKLRCLV
jgi:thiamine-phosphate pyrophosphorylase